MLSWIELIPNLRGYKLGTPAATASNNQSGCFVVVIVVAFFAAFPKTAQGYGGQLGVGAEAGYCASGRIEDTPPGSVHGGAFGAHLTYGFNDSWGISAEGNFDLHTPYVIYKKGEVEGEVPGVTEVDWVEDLSVDRSFASSVTLSVVYIVDVMRMLPFIALGVNGVRVDQRSGSVTRTGYAFGVRISLGVDYMLTDNLGLGAVLHYDNNIVGRSDFLRRIEILARITFFFDVANLGSRRQQG